MIKKIVIGLQDAIDPQCSVNIKRGGLIPSFNDTVRRVNNIRGMIITTGDRMYQAR